MPRPASLLQPLLQFDQEAVVLEGTADAAISAMPTIEAPAASEKGITDALASGDDLSAQRWGLIVPMGTLGDRLLSCLAPLIEQRARQQDIPKEQIMVLRVPTGSDLSWESARAWRDSYYETIADWDRPSYLLILGNLHEIPESIHRSFPDRLVGRLAFSLPGGEPDFAAYRKYAEKVLRWEGTPSPHKRARARLLVVNDGTTATNTAMDVLVKPLFTLADRAGPRLPLSDINRTEEAWLAAREPLLAQANAGAPTVLFSVSHGYGGPRRGWGREQSDQQRTEQGALCFTSGSERLYGRDLSAVPSFLPGGVWFMLACYGAGTPRLSHYRHWLERLVACDEFAASADLVLRSLPTEGERPFIAALPQAALAHPEGPLACIGHLDLAWTYSFQDLDTGHERSRPEAFFGLLRTLARRGRVGLAHAQLLQALQRTHVHLTDLYDTAEASQSPIRQAQLGHLWMLRQDLAGYVLLGDPAARLPLLPADA